MKQVEPKTCPECGAGYWGNIGYHAERCYGRPPKRVCGCPPGWQHEPDCIEVAVPGGESGPDYTSGASVEGNDTDPGTAA